MVKPIANTFGSKSSVRITKRARENPIINTILGNPSLYITKKKEKKTNAKPVSFWAIDKIAGTTTMLVAINCDFILLKTVSTWERYFANARFTKSLNNSAGCT